MTNLLELKQRLIAERGYNCECCGLPQTILELHHCLIHRMKKYPCLDDPRNIQLVCSVCHNTIANSWENKVKFMARQRERFNMDAWIASLPLKIKPIL